MRSGDYSSVILTPQFCPSGISEMRNPFVLKKALFITPGFISEMLIV